MCCCEWHHGRGASSFELINNNTATEEERGGGCWMLADVQVHDEENHALPTRLIIVPFLAPVEDLSIL
jgi:hypothetical protein